MSTSAFVPSRFGDIRSPQNSAEPKVSKIFGQVFVARQRSSMLAGFRPRVASSYSPHQSGGSLPASYKFAAPPGVAKRMFIANCRPAMWSFAPSHDAVRLVLIEAQMDEGLDEIARLRNTLGDRMGYAPGDRVGRVAIVLCGAAEK